LLYIKINNLLGKHSTG